MSLIALIFLRVSSSLEMDTQIAEYENCLQADKILKLVESENRLSIHMHDMLL